MGRRKIFHLSFWILTFLLFCTAVSFQIQKLMVNEVTLEVPEKDQETGGLVFPASCVRETEYGERGLYRVVKEEGAFQEEQVVEFYSPGIIHEDEQKIIIMNDGLDLNAAGYSAYPLEDGMKVEVIMEEPDDRAVKMHMEKQKGNLYLLAFSIVAAFVMAFVADRLLVSVFERKPGKCVAGTVLVLAAAGLLYYSMGRLDIPRQCLPEETIFDISFYIGR